MTASSGIKRSLPLLSAFALFLPVQGHAKESPITVLADAVRKGDLQKVETLLANGVDPNQRVPGERLQYTPLFLSVDANQLEITRALLKAGADPAIEDENGDPVMTLAADPEHLDQAKLLIENGVSIDFKNRAGITALLRTVPYGEADEVQTLIDLGAKPDVSNPDGYTALMLAVITNQLAGAEILIKAGAKIDLLNKRGESAFQLVFNNDLSDGENEAAPQIVSLLIDNGADINQRDPDGLTPLLRALNSYSPKIPAIEVLLKAKPDLLARDKDGRDALFHIVLKNDPKLPAQLLIDSGADVGTVDNDQADLLMISAGNSSPEQVRFFLDQGLSPKIRNKQRASATHYAARSGRSADTDGKREEIAGRTLEILKLLESRGGSLADPDNRGETPLHWACLAGTAPVVAYLLPHYPDASLRDSEGDTPLHLAASTGVVPLIDLLTPKYPDVDLRDAEGFTPLMIASFLGHKESILQLLKAGAKIDATDHGGTNALNAALARDDVPHLKFLITNGADPKSIANPDAELLRAARQFHVRPISPDDYSYLIGLLAGLATDINRLDGDRMSALMWIAASNNKPALEAILKFHPDLNLPTPDGRTAMMWAASSGATGSLHPLREAGADGAVRDGTGRDAEDWLKWSHNSEPSSKIELPKGTPSLAEQLKNNQHEALKNYLTQNTWNANDRIMGSSPLHLAAAMGDTDALATLLKRGAPPDQIIDDHSTPLMEAAANGRLEAVEFLLSHGADPSLRDAGHQRAIDHAVDFRHTEIARLLLGKSDSLSSDEATLITSLVASGDKDLLRDFLKAGASIPPKDKRIDDPFSGSTLSDEPMKAAAVLADPDYLKILVEFASATGADNSDYLATALSLAADRGRLANVKYLMEDLKVNPDCMQDDSLGGVMRIESSDKTTEKTIKGFTPLSRALENGNDDVVRYLIEHGAIITGRTRSGAPPLNFVIQHHQREWLELFLERKAETEFVDFSGQTALHVAAAADDAVAVRLLLDHGADKNAKNDKGQTPLDLARNNNAKQAPALLEARPE